MPRRPEPEPKPFFWVSLDKPPQKDRPVFHEKFEGWTGHLVWEIEVLSDYLYVGRGNLDLVRLPDGHEQARYAFARRDGKLVVPATSVKGAVRAVFEAITNSCVSQRHRRENRSLSVVHMACGLVRKGKEGKAQLCPACRVFGTTGYRGRVYFSDAVPVGDVPTKTIKIADLWPPRQVRKARKFYQTKAFQGQDLRPRKNTRFLEVVPKGSRFCTTLYFENLSGAEMGALMRALGLGLHSSKPNTIVYAFPLKLGGAKPRCLGSVRFHPRSVFIQTSSSTHADDLWQRFLQPAPGGVKNLLLQWLQFEALLDEEAWQQFRAEAQPQTDEACPREVY